METKILTDETLDDVLNTNQPVLLLLTSGEGLRGDFVTAFRKAAGESSDVVFAKLDPTKNPKAAERFEVGSKPVMIAWHCGETIVRRSRPWGTDVPLALEMLRSHQATPPTTDTENDEQVKPTTTEGTLVYNEPIAVTDETFEDEVINSELPVLVDFWAEWCGPCRMVAPILDKLAGEFAGQVKIAKVDVDANQGLAQAFQIMSIPTMMAVKSKAIVFNQPGALPEPALRDLIQQLIALEVPPQEEREESSEPSAD